MAQLLSFPSGNEVSSVVLPTVFTPDLVTRLAATNQVARTVRSLGYRVQEWEISPKDGGSPLLLVELNGLTTRPLQHLSSCCVRNGASGYESFTIAGVRVVSRDVNARTDFLI